VGHELSDVRGRLTGRLRLAAGGPEEFQAGIQLESLRVGSWQVERLGGRVELDSPGRRLRAVDLTAEAYGGELSGLVELEYGVPRPAYAIALRLSNADLARLIPLPPGTRSNGGSAGRLDAQLAVQGIRGEARGREGTGTVRLREARIGSLPLFMTLFAALDVTPRAHVIHEGQIDYILMEDTLQLRRVTLRGPSVGLIGRGAVDLRSRELDVVLVAGPPERLRIPVLSELVDAAARDLMQIHVSGTWSQPRIETRPLAGVTRVLEELFGIPPRGMRSRP
jgi:hypothetical protein